MKTKKSKSASKSAEKCGAEASGSALVCLLARGHEGAHSSTSRRPRDTPQHATWIVGADGLIAVTTFARGKRMSEWTEEAPAPAQLCKETAYTANLLDTGTSSEGETSDGLQPLRIVFSRDDLDEGRCGLLYDGFGAPCQKATGHAGPHKSAQATWKQLLPGQPDDDPGEGIEEDPWTKSVRDAIATKNALHEDLVRAHGTCGKLARHGDPCSMDAGHIARGERHSNGKFTWALRGKEAQAARNAKIEREAAQIEADVAALDRDDDDDDRPWDPEEDGIRTGAERDLARQLREDRESHAAALAVEETALVAPQPQPQMLTVEKARQFLAQSKNVDEVRDVADKAKAVTLYLRSRDASIESQNDAAEIRLRAERRLGELTAELPKQTGGDAARARSKKATEVTAPPTLAEQGIDKRDAAKWQQLAAIPEEKFEEFVGTTRAKGERLTASAPLKLAKLDDKAKHAAQLRAKPIPIATGRFDVIVADPAWEYKKRAGDVTQRGATPYPTMTVDEICALPVDERVEADCILWLWTTNAFMRDAYRVLDAWGFVEKTILTWAKDRMGTGDWLRGQTEHCILAVRGKPIVQLTNQTTLIHGTLREHSRKPDEFFAFVESLCPGTKLELFAREARPGWAAWGAEVEKFAPPGRSKILTATDARARRSA